MPVVFPQGDPRKKLAALEAALREGAYEACNAAGLATAALAKKTVTDFDAVDRGLLRASINSKTERTPAGAQSVVYAGALYAQYVEFGRAGILADPRKDKKLGGTAAWPPVSAIEGWVRRQWKKLAPSGRSASGKARRPREKDIKSLTFLIGRKIYRYGISPRPYLVPSFNQIIPLFRQMVIDAAGRRLASFFRGGSP